MAGNRDCWQQSWSETETLPETRNGQRHRWHRWVEIDMGGDKDGQRHGWSAKELAVDRYG